jgi:hypothetical protein
MKRLLIAALAAGAVGSALAQPQVGVTVRINQPGVYGRIQIGDAPRPALVMPQPVIISQPRVVVQQREPVYLYVPPAHQQNWRRHCGRYAACGQPVYFVREEWVRERYEQEHPGWNRGRHRGWDKDKDRDRGHGRGHDKHKHKNDHQHDRRD